MRHPVIAVAAFGVALTWLLYAVRSDGEPVARAAAMTAAAGASSSQLAVDELSSLRRQLFGLQAEVRAARLQPIPPAPPAPVAASTGAGLAPEVASLTHEEILAEERALADRVAGAADDRFEREPADPAWSTATESQIATTLDTLALPGLHVQAAECRLSLCRLVVEHDDLEHARAFAPAVADQAPFDGMSMYFHYDEGRIVAYALRAGYDAPRPES